MRSQPTFFWLEEVAVSSLYVCSESRHSQLLYSETVATGRFIIIIDVSNCKIWHPNQDSDERKIARLSLDWKLRFAQFSCCRKILIGGVLSFDSSVVRRSAHHATVAVHNGGEGVD